MNKIHFAIFTILGLVFVIVVAVTRPGPQTPLVDYNWSSFVENPRLSQDFTSSVKEVLDPQHTENNPHWLRMKREVFPELGYLGYRELHIELLRGFKSTRYVGFTVIKRDGAVVKSWTTASEHYFFPMVVIFQDDGSLLVKTNGEEKKFPYNQASLQAHFTWLLYTVLSDGFKETQRYQERELEKQRAAQQDAAKQLEKNRRSWE